MSQLGYSSEFYSANKFSSVQSLSHVPLFVTPWTAACWASLSITNSRGLIKLMSIASVMPSNYLILCCPLLLPSIFPSIRVFSNESVSPSNEYSGPISFRMDWLDLLAVQGTLKSLLQHHSSEASVLQCSAFFIVQLSHPYMTTGETISLDSTAARREGQPTSKERPQSVLASSSYFLFPPCWARPVQSGLARKGACLLRLRFSL